MFSGSLTLSFEEELSTNSNWKTVKTFTQMTVPDTYILICILDQVIVLVDWLSLSELGVHG